VLLPLTGYGVLQSLLDHTLVNRYLAYFT